MSSQGFEKKHLAALDPVTTLVQPALVRAADVRALSLEIHTATAPIPASPPYLMRPMCSLCANVIQPPPFSLRAGGVTFRKDTIQLLITGNPLTSSMYTGLSPACHQWLSSIGKPCQQMGRRILAKPPWAWLLVGSARNLPGLLAQGKS